VPFAEETSLDGLHLEIQMQSIKGSHLNMGHVAQCSAAATAACLLMSVAVGLGQRVFKKGELHVGPVTILGGVSHPK
jgi:hypothetical protein